MDSSDLVYGTIFVLYVALFLVIGGYVCTRRKRKHVSADAGKKDDGGRKEKDDGDGDGDAGDGSRTESEEEETELKTEKKDLRSKKRD